MKTPEQITRERIQNLNEIQVKSDDLGIRWLAHEKLKDELKKWWDRKYSRGEEL
ncbi:MAG: hypothetical protein ACXAC7_22995 [Candidatus Hodarchaeales archaeon]|jgi:hypothetical protein